MIFVYEKYTCGGMAWTLPLIKKKEHISENNKFVEKNVLFYPLTTTIRVEKSQLIVGKCKKR